MICKLLALAALAVLTLMLPPASAQPPGAVISVRRTTDGVWVQVSASRPFQFSLRQVSVPGQLIIDVRGLARVQVDRRTLAAPVRDIQVVQGAGGIRILVVLAGPVAVDTDLRNGGRMLILTLRPQTTSAVVSTPAAPRAPPGVQPTEVVRVRHVTAREIAAHLHAVLPGLTVRADNAGNTLVLSGPPETLAQAKQLIAALDVPPATAPVTEAILLRVLGADSLAPLLAAMFPEAKVRADDRLKAVIVAAPPRVLEQIKQVIAEQVARYGDAELVKSLRSYSRNIAMHRERLKAAQASGDTRLVDYLRKEISLYEEQLSIVAEEMLERGLIQGP